MYAYIAIRICVFVIPTTLYDSYRLHPCLSCGYAGEARRHIRPRPGMFDMGQALQVYHKKEPIHYYYYIYIYVERDRYTYALSLHICLYS